MYVYAVLGLFARPYFPFRHAFFCCPFFFVLLLVLLIVLIVTRTSHQARPPAGGVQYPVAPVAGWYADPQGRHQYRYWDGMAWTHHVADGGVSGIDPL